MDRNEDMFQLKSSHVNLNYFAISSYNLALSNKNSSYSFNGSSDSKPAQKPFPDVATNSAASNSLIDFETAVEPALPKIAASTKNKDGNNFHIDAKFDFTRRSTAE